MSFINIDDLNKKGYFLGSSYWGTMYGKVNGVDGDTVSCVIYTKMALSGDRGQISISQISKVLTKEEFMEGLSSIGAIVDSW